MTNWREFNEDEEVPVVRDEGTFLERAVGWLLVYPVRTLIAVLIVVIFLTFACGL